MANEFAGMFRDPRSYRDERLNKLMQDRMSVSGMGGSMNQLLGQVAAGGGATGAQLAEGIGGMFGLQTREEAQAQQLQDMASQVSMEDPDALGAFAKQLNEMGMTKEAIQVMEKRQAVMDRIQREADAAEERARKGSEFDTRTRDVYEERRVMVPVWDTKKENIVGYRPDIQNVRITEYYNPETKKFERRAGSESGSSVTANPREEWLKMMAGSLEGKDETPAPKATTVGDIKLSVAQEQAFRQKWKESGSELPFEEWVKTTMPDRTNITGGAVLSPEEQAAYNQYLEKMFIATQRPMSKEDWVKQYRSK